MPNKNNRPMGFQTVGLVRNDAVRPATLVQPSKKATEHAVVKPPVEDMAPLLFGGWTPSREQRLTAEHFGTTGDVFDSLGL